MGGLCWQNMGARRHGRWFCLQARAIRRPAARAAAQQSVAAAQGERLQASRAAQLTSTVQACFQKQRGSRIVY